MDGTEDSNFVCDLPDHVSEVLIYKICIQTW